jgi:hypothetical protein
MSDVIKKNKEYLLEYLVDSVHILVLSGFALAQPLFDVLSKYAQFFVTRKSEPADIFLLSLILCLLIPGILVMIEGLVGLINKRARKVFHSHLVITLIAIIALPILKKFPGISSTAIIVTAAMIGFIFVIAYINTGFIRTFLTYLSPAILLFPILFLFRN